LCADASQARAGENRYEELGLDAGSGNQTNTAQALGTTRVVFSALNDEGLYRKN